MHYNKQAPTQRQKPEIWAGIECTVNRVGDAFLNQMARNGHDWRISDLDLIADLGVKAIRYPVIWELTAPNDIKSADWSWADERLGRLRELGIRPIVGLVHHGSGPAHTSLVDPDFPRKLADYAQAVAERYPWVDAYTPVNEPLTTARFSGMYGHWYPHGKDDTTFATALLTECRATIEAMRRIRQVNPDAQLVQTEDMGKIYSTPTLAYQADLENERRWLSFDLLCGMLWPDKPMWEYLLQCGVTLDELNWFLDNPCPPDIIGINHYLSSNRYLDDNLSAYPKAIHGGNGTHRYADIEAVRALPQSFAGYYELLHEVWDRYHLPLAITEAHLGCTREEQMRWLKDAWLAVNRLHEEGVDMRAMTVWSLLGAFDWNMLVTQDNGFYEPGAFDIRGGEPRPTAVAEMVKKLAHQQDYQHPVINMEGWWQRDDRFLYPPAPRRKYQLTGTSDCAVTHLCKTNSHQPLVIIGANGTLGRAFAAVCDIRGLPYYLLSRQDLDITDATAVTATLARLGAWGVVNAAGYVRVDDAERDRDRCWLANVTGPANLAAACDSLNISLVTFSSDLVFDGSHHQPYVESDDVCPLNVYGASKAEAEKQVLERMPSALVIRTSAFFGPWDPYNFITMSLQQLGRGEALHVANDVFVSPTYVPDLVNATLDLLIDEANGIWHISNTGVTTWAELAHLSAKMAGMNHARIRESGIHELETMIARRPNYSVLGTERAALLPPLDHALARYFQETQFPISVPA